MRLVGCPDCYARLLGYTGAPASTSRPWSHWRRYWAGMEYWLCDGYALRPCLDPEAELEGVCLACDVCGSTEIGLRFAILTKNLYIGTRKGNSYEV